MSELQPTLAYPVTIDITPNEEIVVPNFVKILTAINTTGCDAYALVVLVAVNPPQPNEVSIIMSLHHDHQTVELELDDDSIGLDYCASLPDSLGVTKHIFARIELLHIEVSDT